MKKYLVILSGLVVLIPLQAIAHGGHGTGFMAGLTHPVFGVDHAVAIIGAGVLGFTMLREKQWLPSLAFVLAMVVGALLGINAEAFGISEWVIVLSVLVTGLLIAFEVQMPPMIYALLFALFGFFHGHAHGTEMPEHSNVPLFILGFVVGVGLLSIIGWGVTRLIKEPVHIRLLGAFVAGMGLMMLLG